MPRLTTPLRLLAVTLTAGLFISCDRSADPGIAEKVALLEAELRDRDQQLATIQEAATPAAESVATAAAATADVNAAQANYLKFIEGVRTKLIAGLPETKFDRTSVFPVEGPDPLKPIQSRVAFRILHKDGRSGEIVVPLAADLAGSWQEPATDEIIANFKAKSAAVTVVATTSQKTLPAATSVTAPRSQPTDVMGASRTVVIPWDETKEPKPNPAPPAPSDSAPAANPVQPVPPPNPGGPKKVMPADRDITIDFDN